jgi:copper chaperone
MTTFRVNDMTCDHCVRTITGAVRALDPGAKVQIDLPTHRVQIEAGKADAAELSDAIKEVGYTPVSMASTENSRSPASVPARSGCCCS